MAIELTDDGTLDTVLRCSECGEEMRYSYDGPNADYVRACEHADYHDGCPECTAAAEREYDEFIDWAIEDATADHECPAADSEPSEDDLTTSDHRTFYQYGRRVLWCPVDSDLPRAWFTAEGNIGTFDTCEQALRAYMDRVQFWPAAWFISDHGNAHLIDLSEGK